MTTTIGVIFLTAASLAQAQDGAPVSDAKAVLDTNAPAEGRASNRRMELKVLENAQTPAAESAAPDQENLS